MVNWQVTATTIYCGAVDDEVTILVQKDWSVQCTGYRKYGESGKEAINLARKSKQLRRQIKCEGPECRRVVQYKEKLLAEESRKAA